MMGRLRDAGPLNGGTAAKLYQRHVIPTLTDGQRAMATTTLPSTSPVHAGVSFPRKAARWFDVLREARAKKGQVMTPAGYELT